MQLRVPLAGLFLPAKMNSFCMSLKKKKKRKGTYSAVEIYNKNVTAIFALIMELTL